MSDVNDESARGTEPEPERTVTIAGKPLLVAGIVAFLESSVIRRRRRGTAKE